MRISIVTPVFNRAEIMHRSIQSSLRGIREGHFDELVLVDDASSDDSVSQIKQIYSAELTQGVIVLVELPTNVGVAGAKNAGALHASGDWLIFMDSDDAFVDDAMADLRREIVSHPQDVIQFYRCRNFDTKSLIGPEQDAGEITLRRLLNGGTPGECLPILKRTEFLTAFYPTELRGSEALTYLQLAKSGCRIYLSSLVAREYDDSGNDRLSNRRGVYKRAPLLIKHNLRLLKFWRFAQTKTLIGWVIRICYYSLIVLVGKHK